mgnify:CR=1 FL=1
MKIQVTQEDLTITVTQDDIDRGKKGMAYVCPITYAMRRAGCQAPSVSLHCLVWNDENGGCKSWQPSEQVKEFVQAFYNGKKVHPFAFEIDRATTIRNRKVF